MQAGKSTLANALLGKVDIPPCRSCAFKTCNGNHACTQETTYSHDGLWLGEDMPFTVVDNPGFATLVKDSNNDEDIGILTDNLVNILENDVKSADAIILVIKGSNKVLTREMYILLNNLEATFGDDIWNNIIICVSNWSYKITDIYDREVNGIGEEGFIQDWNHILKKKFSFNHNLKGVFIDAFTQVSWKLAGTTNEYKQEQEKFISESMALWEFAEDAEPFIFKTAQTLKREKRQLDAEVNTLRGTIENDITELRRQFGEFRNMVSSVDRQYDYTLKNGL